MDCHVVTWFDTVKFEKTLYALCGVRWTQVIVMQCKQRMFKVFLHIDNSKERYDSSVVCMLHRYCQHRVDEHSPDRYQWAFALFFIRCADIGDLDRWTLRFAWSNVQCRMANAQAHALILVFEPFRFVAMMGLLSDDLFNHHPPFAWLWQWFASYRAMLDSHVRAHSSHSIVRCAIWIHRAYKSSENSHIYLFSFQFVCICYYSHLSSSIMISKIRCDADKTPSSHHIWLRIFFFVFWWWTTELHK